MINASSLRFRMSAWYAIVIGVCMAVNGALMYVGVSKYLQRALQRSLSTEAHVIADKFLPSVPEKGLAFLKGEITEMDPEFSGTFIRVKTGDGKLLYTSPPPLDRTFDPSRIAVTASAGNSEFMRTVNGAGEQPVLLDVLPTRLPSGETYVVEVGSSTKPSATVIRGVGLALLLSFPIVVAFAIGGAILISRKAMRPLDVIADKAERFTSRKFGERLPVVHTGDEIERLTVSLNRMIGRLEEAFHHIERFSADVSHELRTPLAILRGELELVQRTKGLPTAVAERIGSSLEELERLSRIVSQLLEISRLEAGPMQKDPAPIDLGLLATNTSEQMRLLADIKAIALHYEITPGCYVEGSAGLLTQVVANLLDNAIKYTPAGGRVDVAVSRGSSRVRLEVRDNGMGIPADDLPKIFERFYRADPTRSHALSGAGLGLAIVKSICAAHGGSLAVDSRDGAGTSITIEFPMAETRSPLFSHSQIEPASEKASEPAERR